MYGCKDGTLLLKMWAAVLAAAWGNQKPLMLV